MISARAGILDRERNVHMGEEGGEPINGKVLLVETEQSVMKCESPTTGTVFKLLAAEADTIFWAGINTAKRPRGPTT